MNVLIEQLRRDLSEGRFRHSLGVAVCARKLAERFGCDAEKAYLAGLLHDCATRYSAEDMLALALETGLRREDEISGNPVADYHAELGAFVARRDHGVDDPSVLQAIAFHQMGGVPMTALDMVVGLSDGIEPSRKGEAIDAIRETAKSDLKKAYLEKYTLYMMNILRARQPMSQRRVDVYHYLLTLQ